MIQLASDSGNAAALVFFLFDLLHLDGEDMCPRPLIERPKPIARLPTPMVKGAAGAAQVTGLIEGGIGQVSSRHTHLANNGISQVE
jgi:hypothetical protein